MKLSIRKENGVSFYIIMTFLMFFLIYQSNLSFLGLPPQLHSTRLSVVLLVAYAIYNPTRKFPGYIKTYKLGKTLGKILKLYTLVTILALMLLLLVGPGQGHNAFFTLVNTYIIAVPSIWACSRLFKDLDSFMRVLLFVGIIQSVVIVTCLLVPSFMTMLSFTFNAIEDTNSEYNFEDLIENYAGGIGCITSSGVLLFASGLMATVYFYIKKNNNFYLYVFFVMAVVSSMIARTGAIIDAVCLLFVILNKAQGKRAFSLIFGLLIVCFVGSSLIDSGNYNSFLNERYRRYFSLQENKGEVFFTDYFEGERTSYPPLENNLLMGEGVFSGRTSSGLDVNVDGGFLRFYSAFGLIAAVIFYTTLFYYMIQSRWRVFDKSLRSIIFLVLIIYIIGEFKEFYLLTSWPITFYFLILILDNVGYIETNET